VSTFLLSFARIYPDFKRLKMAFPPRVITQIFAATLSIFLFAGCSITGRMASSLTASVNGQSDPQLIGEALPTLIVTVDALINNNPKDPDLLFAGARLYGSYGGFFVTDTDRQIALTNKALSLANRGLCQTLDDLCDALNKDNQSFEAALKAIDHRGDLPALMSFGGAWVGWLQVNAGDFTALTQMPRVRRVIEHAVALDETYDNAIGHVYLGALNSQIPPSLGGRPDIGRGHFERAIELTGGQNLVAKALFAQTYCRLVFDQELHDQLVEQVLQANPDVEGLTLMNALAQQIARELKASGSDYF
jgi:hypothetical protein